MPRTIGVGSPHARISPLRLAAVSSDACDSASPPTKHQRVGSLHGCFFFLLLLLVPFPLVLLLFSSLFCLEGSQHEALVAPTWYTWIEPKPIAPCKSSDGASSFTSSNIA